MFRYFTRFSSPIARAGVSVFGRKRLISNVVFVRKSIVDEKTESPLAGREWLPGARAKGNKFPKTLAGPRENFPTCLQAVNGEPNSITSPETIVEWAKKSGDEMRENLHDYGAILFRGLPLRGAKDFSLFSDNLGFAPMDYTGGISIRSPVISNVSMASDEPPEVDIELHNELSYTNHFPLKFLFFCDTPAKVGCGGETAIANVRDISSELDANFTEKLEKLGIRYTVYALSRNSKEPNNYRPWQDMFLTEDKKVVEEHMKSFGKDYQWEADNSLRFWINLPARTDHPITGESLWFNQASVHNASYFHAHPFWVGKFKNIPNDRSPFHSYYGDGTEIEDGVLQHIREVSWKVAVGFQMKQGDVLALDNLLVQHSRLSFSGKRRLMVSLFRT